MKTQALPISFLHLTEINLASLFWGTKNTPQLSPDSHENNRKQDIRWLTPPLCCRQLLWLEKPSSRQFTRTLWPSQNADRGIPRTSVSQRSTTSHLFQLESLNLMMLRWLTVESDLNTRKHQHLPSGWLPWNGNCSGHQELHYKY